MSASGRRSSRSAWPVICVLSMLLAATAALSSRTAVAATPEELAAGYSSNCFDANYSYSATACETWLGTLPQADAEWVVLNLIAPPFDSQSEDGVGGAGWLNPDASRWTMGPDPALLNKRQAAYFIRLEQSSGGYWYNYYTGVLQQAAINSRWWPIVGWKHETHWRANFRFYWCDDGQSMRGCNSSTTEWIEKKSVWRITQNGTATRTSHGSWLLYRSLSKIERKVTVRGIGYTQPCDVESTVEIYPRLAKQSHWYPVSNYVPLGYKTRTKCNTSPVISG